MCEQVPSWQVTSEMLEAWGFPVEKRDKCVGMQMIESPGMTFGRALHAAWAAGFVRMSVTPEWVVEEMHANFRVRLAEQQRCAQESLAFLQEHGLIHRTA